MDRGRELPRASAHAPALRPLRVLGLVNPFAGGAGILWLVQVSVLPFMLGVVATAAIGALLTRTPSWYWLIPLAAWLGSQAAEIAYGALQGYLSEPTWWGGTIELAADLVMLAVLPACGGVGVVILTLWLLRLAHRRHTGSPL